MLRWSWKQVITWLWESKVELAAGVPKVANLDTRQSWIQRMYYKVPFYWQVQPGCTFRMQQSREGSVKISIIVISQHSPTSHIRSEKSWNHSKIYSKQTSDWLKEANLNLHPCGLHQEVSELLEIWRLRDFVSFLCRGYQDLKFR